MPNPLAALLDPQFRQDVGTNTRGLLQSASNSVAQNVTGPVDILAWLLRKSGMPIPQNPMGGSAWAEQKGLLQQVPDGAPKVAGETLGGVAPFVGAAKAPQIASGLLKADEALQPVAARMADKYMEKIGGKLNVVAPQPINAIAEMLRDGKPRLISSQKYIDEDRVLQKIKNKDFEVKLSKPFKVDGELLQSIEDGHHALEAAKVAGVKPKFVTQTSTQNDRNLLIDSGKIDDFLTQSYVDSPWRYFDTGKEIW